MSLKFGERKGSGSHKMARKVDVSIISTVRILSDGGSFSFTYIFLKFEIDLLIIK
tara:strand:- start:64 stop:228 length:165 start_codon:yes stop_codon:yes gene_type:complete